MLADVLICHAAPENKDETPGTLNEYLGQRVRQIYSLNTQLVLIVQGEVYPTVTDLPVAYRIPKQSERRSGWITTHRVNQLALIHCEMEKLSKKAIVLSHRDHLWRAVMSAKKLGFQVFIPFVEDTPRDPLCSKWWRRSKKISIGMEVGKRLQYLVQRKI